MFVAAQYGQLAVVYPLFNMQNAIPCKMRVNELTHFVTSIKDNASIKRRNSLLVGRTGAFVWIYPRDIAWIMGYTQIVTLMDANQSIFEYERVLPGTVFCSMCKYQSKRGFCLYHGESFLIVLLRKITVHHSFLLQAPL